jgi:hypothetical protein
LVEQVQELLPEGAQVVLLGDGECDGTDLQHTLEEAGWSYVCRTGCHLPASWKDAPFRLATLGACIKPGPLIELKAGLFPRAADGPIMLVCCWATGYQEPLYGVSNPGSAAEACRLYAKRFRIATFFSEQHSRGFHRHQSHLAEPQRLSHLLIAACCAYIGIVYLGAVCEQERWVRISHRGERCD